MKTPKDVLVRKLPGFLYGTWSAEGVADVLLEALAAAGYAVVEAAEIERLRGELREAEGLDALCDEWEARLGAMRAALEKIRAYPTISPQSATHMAALAESALTSDTGKAAADVLTAVENARNNPCGETYTALWRAHDAYRKEGRDDD